MEEKRPIVNKIFERDIDLLLMEELRCDPDFLRLFLAKTDWPQWQFDPGRIETYQSEYMENGEADVVAVFTYPDGARRALLIEDKINAPTQKDQSQRYTKNAKQLLKRKGLKDVKTFLVAPEKYLLDHKDDANAADFEYRLTYEELISFFESRNDPRFYNKAELLRFAVEKQKRGSDKIVDPKITEFWRRLSEHIESYYPELEFISKTVEKSKNDEFWVCWYTPIKGANLYWKADHGYIDLQVAKCGGRVREFYERFNNILLPGMRIEKAGGSLVFRLENARCWRMSFSENFDENIHRVDHALSYVYLIYNFVKTLDRGIFK